MKNWTWKTWAVIGVAVYLIVRNPSGSGAFVSHVVSALSTFVGKI